MAADLTFSPYTTWADVVDDNNVPPGAKPIGAADLLRYENFMVAAKNRINEHDSKLIDTSGQLLTTLTTALPTTLTTINAALAVSFKVPDSGQVTVELTQHVKLTAKGKLQWVVAAAASPFTAVFTLTAINEIHEGYVTARRLVTGLTPDADLSWIWRHQVVAPGAGALQIGAEYPALITVRAA